MPEINKFYYFFHNNHFIQVVFILFNIIIFSNCSCPYQVLIDNQECFNDVIKFANKKYRAGHFVTYKNGDLIAEFSDDGGPNSPSEGFSRMFYGLKADGRYYFPDETPTYEILNITGFGTIRGRYESLNQLVVTENDLNRDNEYLFSTSSYDSLTELHDIKNKNYIYVKSADFMGKSIFSFQYSMVEVEYDNNIFYFIGFTHSSTDSQNGDRLDIKKFGFKSFNLNDIHYYNQVNITDNLDARILNLFVLKDLNILVLVYIYKDKSLRFKYYNYNLEEQGNEQSLFKIEMKTEKVGGVEPRDRDGVFFKSVELKDNKRAFLLYDDGVADKLIFRIYSFSSSGTNSYSATELLSINSTNYRTYRFLSYITLNDIYKISENRIAIASLSANKEGLVLILYDLYNNYKNIKMRFYFVNIASIQIQKELSLYSFNNFLMLTMTGSTFADLIIFGYANGTDSTLNLSLYLKDHHNYDPNSNLINELFQSLTIDNNLFGYKETNQVKIISIPEGLKFNKITGDTGAIIEEIVNGTIIDKDINYELIQNKEVIKTNKYYNIYYQHMVKEPDYSDFYSKESATDDNSVYTFSQDNSYNNYANDFVPNVFYGRTNKLSFKLCFEYCDTCKELGYDIDNQMCVTCLPDYIYDYWIYFNQTYDSNCVPLNYMNKLEEKKVVKCDEVENYKYYINKTMNSKICFKYEYECPKEYDYFNTTNNECTDYNPPLPSTTLLTEWMTMEPLTTEQPTTQQPTTYQPTTQQFTTEEPTTEQVEEEIPTTEQATTEEFNIVQATTEERRTEQVEEEKSTTEQPATEEFALEQSTTEEQNIEQSSTEQTDNEQVTTEQYKTEEDTIEQSFTEDSTENQTLEPTEKSTEIQNIKITEKIKEITTQNIIQKSTIPNTSNNTSGICSYNIYVNSSCSFENLNQEESYNKIKDELIKTFPPDGQSITIDTDEDSFFQVTNTKNEEDLLIKNTGNTTIIELGYCEINVKEYNDIPLNSSLILLKYENKANSTSEKNIQYEIYDPNTYEKLDLSVCEDDINIYIPITLQQESQILFNEVKKQDYDLLNLNGKFYKDVCTPFTSDKNTDILLNDRINYYYSKIVKEVTCPQNCNLLLYMEQNNYLKCQCEINNEDINTDNSVNLNKYSNFDYLFINDYKYRSYKTMKCVNLVFDNKIFRKNAGGILVLLFFIAHLAFMGLYIYQNMSPIKACISEIIDNKKNNNLNSFDIHKVKKRRIENKHTENECTNKANPPKNGDLDNNDIEVVKYNKNKDDKVEIHSIKSNDIIKPKLSQKYETENILNTNLKIEIEENAEKKEETNPQETPKLEHYQLYKLDFSEAILLDKRDYLTTYLSTLKREQLIMFIILSWNDYNLFYLKINRLIFLLCTEMTLNALFFADQTIHKLYIEDGEYNFGQSFPHIIYSLLITHVLEILLCYLTMTDIHIYHIKSLKKSEQTAGKAFEILKLIKIKIIIFFIFTGLLFIFYWYCVSAFCAVYQKTQGYFILNSFLSFIFELIDPFIIYALIILLRKLALKYHDKKGMIWVYKISRIFPIF